jgi:hypothetical protein
MKIAFVCVRMGARYPVEYVTKLRNMVERYSPLPVTYFYCVTDQPEQVPGVTNIAASPGLPRWWQKMVLFEHDWRRGLRVVYLDLDSVVVNDLTPLLNVGAGFATCANFTRARQHDAGVKITWPCRYGSCVVVLNDCYSNATFRRFVAMREDPSWMTRYEPYGDQMVMEVLDPDAALLQQLMPPGFFLHYKALSFFQDAPPPEASIIVFGGQTKPHNCTVPWVQRAWR